MKDIIAKAVEGGWNFHKKFNIEDNAKITYSGNTTSWYGSNSGGLIYPESFIFSHDFCIVFWGREFVCKNCGRAREYEECSLHDLGRAEAWQYHGNLMFLSEDRIKYLEGFLE